MKKQRLRTRKGFRRRGEQEQGFALPRTKKASQQAKWDMQCQPGHVQSVPGVLWLWGMCVRRASFWGPIADLQAEDYHRKAMYTSEEKHQQSSSNLTCSICQVLQRLNAWEHFPCPAQVLQGCQSLCLVVSFGPLYSAAATRIRVRIGLLRATSSLCAVLT